MLEARLRRRVLALRMTSLAEYCRYLFDEGGLDEEAADLINAVTTNKTDFFREAEHFRFLTEKAVPTLLAEGGDLKRSPLKVWSAACSIGAEPYAGNGSVRDHRFRPRLHHSGDGHLHRSAQNRGARNLPGEHVSPIPDDLAPLLLRSKDSAADSVRVVPNLRRCVRFGRLNLNDMPYGAETNLHAIFCRNALIYFDKHTQRKVAGELCNHLQPGGFLFVGHSESLTEFDLPLRQVAATIFRRL